MRWSQINDNCRRIHSKTPIEQPRQADNKYHIFTTTTLAVSPLESLSLTLLYRGWLIGTDSQSHSATAMTDGGRARVMQ